MSAKNGIVGFVGPTTRDIGQRVLIAMLGGMRRLMPVPNNNNVEWCPHCNKYFDNRAPHECALRMVRDNQIKLEQWLGRFKRHNS